MQPPIQIKLVAVNASPYGSQLRQPEKLSVTQCGSSAAAWPTMAPMKPSAGRMTRETNRLLGVRLSIRPDDMIGLCPQSTAAASPCQREAMGVRCRDVDCPGRGPFAARPNDDDRRARAVAHAERDPLGGDRRSGGRPADRSLRSPLSLADP